MTKRNTIIFLCASLCAGILLSCKHTVKNPLPTNWRKVTILSEGSTEIVLNNDTDSTEVKYYDFRTIFTPHRKLKNDSLTTYFTKKEKDSIFRLSQQIISNPVESKAGCSEFVGELSITIDFKALGVLGSFEQSIKYTSVCEWDTLSPQTRALHGILKRKIKWWQ